MFKRQTDLIVVSFLESNCLFTLVNLNLFIMKTWPVQPRCIILLSLKYILRKLSFIPTDNTKAAHFYVITYLFIHTRISGIFVYDFESECVLSNNCELKFELTLMAEEWSPINYIMRSMMFEITQTLQKFVHQILESNTSYIV